MGSPYDQPLQYPFASSLFGLDGNGLFGYMIPKPKFMFYVVFTIRQTYQTAPTEIARIGYLVKSVERPKLQYKLQELDQYNRKRVIYTKVDYPSVNITLHDTVDGAVSRMIDDYNRFNFGDFSNMEPNDNSDTHDALWTNNSIVGNDMTYWGYRVKNPNNYAGAGPDNRGLPTPEYFFDEIKIYELYGNNFTMYSLMNPKIESVNYGATDSAASEGQEISITVNPEGVLFRYINAPVDYSTLASMILPGPGFTTGNFPISDIDTTSYVPGMLGASGGGLLSNLTDGLYGAFGSLGMATSIGVAAAASGIIGATAASIASPEAYAQGFAQTAGLASNAILSANTLASMSNVSGAGSGAVTLGKIGRSAEASLDVGNSITRLF